MQNSSYKGQIIPVNTSFAGQDLSHQDFTGTDFSNCDMKDAILTGCIFDKANLSQVQNLTEKQFAGCSLIDAILPKDFKFSYLDNFDKMMTQARDIFALSLSTSLFGIIAVMSTADEDFLVGGKSLTMPLIGVAVDMTSLYIFLPITIMAVGLYLNIYLNKIQAIIKKFPYYLPDGREIELLLYPWLWNYITKPLYHKKRKLRFHYVMFAVLGEFISYAMVHVTAGLSIMIITFTYFKVQDPIMTSFHLGILGIVTFFAFLHFRIKYRERKFVFSFLMPISAFAFTVMMAVCGSFVYVEKPLLMGTKEIVLESPFKITFDIDEIHDIFFNSYITATYKKISQNSSGCITPKRNSLGEIIQNNNDDKSCQNVTGVDLRERNLMNLNAPNSFFVNALLQDTNLKYANLTEADLRWANLQNSDLQNANLWKANLQNADLIFANLQNAYLMEINLQNADLQNAKLQHAELNKADLQDANLKEANLEKASLWGTNLQDANLERANLQNAHLLWANLQDANLQGAELQDAILFWVNLQDANLQEADLQNVNFQGANLQRADLQNADLHSTTLINTNLSDIQFNESTNFTGAFYNSRNFVNNLEIKTTVFPSNFNPVTKGMIDICTPEGKEAIQNKRYKNKNIEWKKVKYTLEKNIECVPPES